MKLKEQCLKCKNYRINIGHCMRGNDSWMTDNWEKEVECEEYEEFGDDEK
ncbi:hypothetical protein [Mesoaciditoga lauensis]|nr:hypothetical protein [Mesoaciditoga lauensis]